MDVPDTTAPRPSTKCSSGQGAREHGLPKETDRYTDPSGPMPGHRSEHLNASTWALDMIGGMEDDPTTHCEALP